MLTVAQALARVLAAVRPASPASGELVHIDDAWGRVLAHAVTATRALPPWDNSSMDGFAVRSADLPGTLPVAGVVAAGHALDAVLAPGTALRIMTGAPMPAGADAVVIREEAEVLGPPPGDRVRFAAPAAPGANVRRRGEDVTVGEPVLRAGVRLGPGELGFLAALGHAAVRVARRPRVAILSTGDELVGVDVPPRPGQIVNSNLHALSAQVREAGAEPVNAGIAPDVPDGPDGLVARIQAALAADVLLTSGGVSVGDFDFVKDAFAAVGVDMDFWKVAMKPGKPLAFGTTSAGGLVFGLPGNPVSSMMCFELFVRPALLALQGAIEVERPRAPVVLTAAYAKQPGRAHYLRAALRRQGDILLAHPHPKQGSGMLSSMIGVDALVEIPAERGDVAAGTRLDALLLTAR